MPTLASRYGPLEAATALVSPGEARPWRAELVERHPRLGGVGYALGATEAESLANLEEAVVMFGSSWPRPPRLGRLEEQDGAASCVEAAVVERVLVDVEGEAEPVEAFAVGWRGELVWVTWQEPRGGYSSSWVPASSVRRAVE